MVSFAVQKLVSLIRSYLFSFVFISTYSRRWIQKDIAATYAKNVLPVFSAWSFIVSILAFRSISHLQCIFVYGIRECSDFVLLRESVQLSQRHLLRRLSFAIVYSCPLCCRLGDHRFYFCTFYPVLLIYVSVSASSLLF